MSLIRVTKRCLRFVKQGAGLTVLKEFPLRAGPLLLAAVDAFDNADT